MTAAIAHLSDPHITTGPLAAAPAQALHLALGRVLALDPRPDCAVITGDLVEHGRPDEYRQLHELIDRFPLPLHLVAGNHDDPETLLGEFVDTRFLGAGPRAHYVVDYPAFALVVLNSSVPGAPGGHLGLAQLTWLEEVLSRRPGTPAIVCLHHPPIDLGIPFLDRMRLDDGAELADVLARHRTTTRILAGHVHRGVTSAFAGGILTTAPSTYLQSGLVLGEEVPDYRPEPTSFLLHLMRGSSWLTHTVPVSHAAARVVSF